MEMQVVARVRARLGSSAADGVDLEGSAPFVGRVQRWHFDCPRVNSAADSVVTFQSLGVSHNRNTLRINGTDIAGGVPMSGIFAWC